MYQYFSHTRPDGTDCFTAFPDGLISKGENIAMGYATYADATDGWKETDDPYSGQGHRRNMLDADFNYVGIAGYKKDGYIYWVQDFGCKHNPKDFDSENSFTIENNNSAIPKFNIELPKYATGYLVVKLNGYEVMRKAIFQGKANINIYGLNPGTYDVELIYGGDNNYNYANKTSIIATTGDDSPNASFSYLNTAIKMTDNEASMLPMYRYVSQFYKKKKTKNRR